MKEKELCTELRNFTEIRDYILKFLGQRGIDKRIKTETILIFEALYNDILAQGIPGDTPVKVWRVRHFGNLSIKIGFEGSVYVPMSDARGGLTVEDKVMHAYAEKIEHRYHSGRNHLIITVKRSASRISGQNLFALGLAILAYIPIVTLIGMNGQQDIVNGLVFQTEKLFTDAMLSIGAPVTFFSFLRNLTKMFIAAEGNSGMRRLHASAIGSSVVSVVLAVGMCLFLQFPMGLFYFVATFFFDGVVPPDMDVDVKVNVSDILESIVTPSIFEPFETFAPFPLIILAILTTYALCSAGSYFNSIKKVVDGCYLVFSTMLSAIMYTLPFFCFLAMLEVMLREGFRSTLYVAGMTILVPLAMIAMVLFYAVRLMTAGINPGMFMKNLIPLIRENLILNSTIDAVPFNTRYCVREYGIDRKKLEDSLPVLAQVNLDGNCFFITLIAVLFVLSNGIGISWFDIIVIGLVVFFLSLGAPNQPGSILIGMLVISNYLQVQEMISLAIYSEALFGSLLSITNATGDIVTVAISDKRDKMKQQILKQ